MPVSLLVFAGLVVVVVAALIFTTSISQDAGIPIIAAALGYVFGAGAQRGVEEVRRIRNGNSPS